MLDKALGDDLHHDFIGVVHALAALEAQRIGQRIGDVGRVGGGKLIGVHQGRIAVPLEHNKNMISTSANVRSGAPRSHALDLPNFYLYKNMEEAVMTQSDADEIARYADMLGALGAEPRLRIVRLLLAAHPEGLVVGEIGSKLVIPPSTLSHHLDKLKNEGLVSVRRESTFLRCTANTKTLREIVGFLFAECCTRNKAIRPEAITCACP